MEEPPEERSSKKETLLSGNAVLSSNLNLKMLINRELRWIFKLKEEHCQFML